MGVRGTFEFLKFAVQKRKLAEFKNQRCAIDVNSWIGRPLCVIYKKVKVMRSMTNQEKTNLLTEITNLMNKTICDFLQKIKILKSHNINMLFVFDGSWPQIKRLVERARQLRKLQRGEASKQNSDESDREAQIQKQDEFNFLRLHQIRTGKLLTLNYRKEVEEVMISTIMRILKDLKIDFMVAPFETDNQIAQLYYKQEIDFAISGDSDFIYYLVPVMTDFNAQGESTYYYLKDFALPRDIPDHRHNVKNFVRVAQDKKKLAILASLSDSGYTRKIVGLQIYEITSLVHLSQNLEQVFIKIDKYLSNKFLDHPGLTFFQKTSARNAYIYYLHAVCFNPKTEKLEWLNQELVPETMKQFNLNKKQFIKITQNPQTKYSYLIRLGLVSIWTNKERELLPLLHFYQDVDTKVKNDKILSFQQYFNYRYAQNNTAIAVSNLLW